MANYFKRGSFNRISDRSGFKFKAERTVKQWDNLIVADREWEPRNAQEFLRGIPDFQAAPDPRPEGADTFVNPNLPLGLYYLMTQTNVPITQQGGGDIYLQSSSIPDNN